MAWYLRYSIALCNHKYTDSHPNFVHCNRIALLDMARRTKKCIRIQVDDEGSHRLRYVVEHINQMSSIPLRISTAPSKCEEPVVELEYRQSPHRRRGTLKIPCTGFLQERAKIETTGVWDISEEGLPYPWASGSGDFPFDVFALIFALLSRYEEYAYDGPLDHHDRFPAEASVAVQHDFLHRALVDRWIAVFLKWLEEKSGYAPLYRPAKARIEWTWDMDFPWAFRHLKWWQHIGAAVRDLWHGDKWLVKKRLQYLYRRDDPYAFASALPCRLEELPPCTRLFVLMRGGTTYDRNHYVDDERFHRALKHWARHIPIGLHPSYGAAICSATLAEEKNRLELLLGRSIRHSRQHYLRLQLPKTYQLLLQHGIEVDYSMGYASQSGFRASSASAFWWYDLSVERRTALRIVPLIFMDATYVHYRPLPVHELAWIFESLIEEAVRFGGQVGVLWHADILARKREDPEYWKFYTTAFEWCRKIHSGEG